MSVSRELSDAALSIDTLPLIIHHALLLIKSDEPLEAIAARVQTLGSLGVAWMNALEAALRQGGAHSKLGVQLCVLCYQHALGSSIGTGRPLNEHQLPGSISVYKGEYLKLMALVDGGVLSEQYPWRPMFAADALQMEWRIMDRNPGGIEFQQGPASAVSTFFSAMARDIFGQPTARDAHARFLRLPPDSSEEVTTAAMGGQPNRRLTALGFLLRKCLLYGQLVYRRFDAFTLAYLLGRHEPLLASPEVALDQLADLEPELAATWKCYLRGCGPGQSDLSGITRESIMGAGYYDEPSEMDRALTLANVAPLVLAGCRRRLLQDRMLKLEALKAGFDALPLSPRVRGLLLGRLRLGTEALSIILHGMAIETPEDFLSLVHVTSMRQDKEAAIKETLRAFSAQQRVQFLSGCGQREGVLSFDEARRQGPLMQFELVPVFIEGQPIMPIMTGNQDGIKIVVEIPEDWTPETIRAGLNEMTILLE